MADWIAEPFSWITGARPLGNAGPTVKEMWGSLGKFPDLTKVDYSGLLGNSNSNGLENLYQGKTPTLGGQASAQKGPAHQRFTEMFSPQGASGIPNRSQSPTNSSSLMDRL